MVDATGRVGSSNYLAQLRKLQSQRSVVAANQIFGKIDANGDGKISKDEFAKARSEAGSNVMSVITDPGALIASFVNALQNTGQAGTSAGAAGTTASDTQGLQKSSATTDEVFNKLDTNGDGVITKDELGAAPLKMHHHGRHKTHGKNPQDTSTSALLAMLQNVQANGNTSGLTADQQATIQRIAPALTQALNQYLQIVQGGQGAANSGTLTRSG